MPNTKSKEVNLTKRVQTLRGMRYCPIVPASNGRLRPGLVLVNGQPERHPEGAYYQEWRENGKRIRLSVGKDAQEIEEPTGVQESASSCSACERDFLVSRPWQTQKGLNTLSRSVINLSTVDRCNYFLHWLDADCTFLTKK